MKAIIQQIMSVPSGQELFGTATDPAHLYKKLARKVHPDMVEAAEQDAAKEAFVRLTSLWEAFQHGTATTTAVTKVKTRKHEYVVGDMRYSDDVFDVYDATYDAGFQRATILIAHDAADEDLAEAYRAALKADFPTNYRAFYPQLLEAFRYTEGGITVPALALSLPDNLYTLAEIYEAYPEGLHGRDIAWMWRRMLVALGNAHEIGLLHGAPIESAWLIEPDQHGVILAGWQYSVQQGEALLSVPQKERDLYPVGVFDKEPQPASLDINIAARTMLNLCDWSRTPRQFEAFFKGCLGAAPDAATLLTEFDELLDRVYGGKQFHIFHMPPR